MRSAARMRSCRARPAGWSGWSRRARPTADDRLIGFDMGGTSTDVSHYAGRFELGDDNLIAGVRIRAPMMQINTVAAGGGSICSFDGMRFRVGPGQRRREPGAGLLPQRRAADGDRLQPVHRAHFGRAFPGIVRPRRQAAARPRRCRASGWKRSRVTPTRRSASRFHRTKSPRDFLRIAVDNMANAIRKISIARGHDVTRYTLACFGGAGGQHACQVADALGMERILIHPLAGVLSAYGIGLAEVKAIREMSWLKPLDEDFSDGLGQLEEAASRGVDRSGRCPGQNPHRTARAAAHARQRQCDRVGDRPARSDARAVRHAAPQTLRLCRGRHRIDRRFARGDGDGGERSRREFRRGGGPGRRADRGWPVERLSPRGNRRRPANRRAGADPRSVVDHGSRGGLDRLPAPTMARWS